LSDWESRTAASNAKDYFIKQIRSPHCDECDAAFDHNAVVLLLAREHLFKNASGLSVFRFAPSSRYSRAARLPFPERNPRIPFFRQALSFSVIAIGSIDNLLVLKENSR